MNLRKIVLASAFLLSSTVASQSLAKLQFDVYSKGEGFFPKFNSGSVKVDSNEIDCSFLFGIYSMKFKKLNDSVYQESVKTNFLWISKEELFEYSFSKKDSRYTLYSYSAIGEKPREEKELLEGRVFDKKFEIPPELFNNFKKGLLEDKDSIHFLIQGEPYSIKINNLKKGDERIYSSTPPKIDEEPGDYFIFPYPAEVYAKNKNGKIIPFKFHTKLLNAKTKKITTIEGELKK
jgi:hypothetical protein